MPTQHLTHRLPSSHCGSAQWMEDWLVKAFIRRYLGKETDQTVVGAELCYSFLRVTERRNPRTHRLTICKPYANHMQTSMSSPGMKGLAPRTPSSGSFPENSTHCWAAGEGFHACAAPSWGQPRPKLGSSDTSARARLRETPPAEGDTTSFHLADAKTLRAAAY